MKKILISLGLCLNFLFADVLLYEGFTLNQDMKETDLKSFTKIDGAKYKLGQGIVFERDFSYEGRDVKQILKFDDNGLLKIVFFYEKSSDLLVDDLFKKPETIKKTKLIRGHVTLKNRNSLLEDKKYTGNTVNQFRDELSETLIDFYNVLDNNILTTTTFLIENPELTNEHLSDNFTGVTKMKSCLVIEKAEDCPKCQYLEGTHFDLSCSNLTIYHPVI